jgi:hypothetical protein
VSVVPASRPFTFHRFTHKPAANALATDMLQVLLTVSGEYSALELIYICFSTVNYSSEYFVITGREVKQSVVKM